MAAYSFIKYNSIYDPELVVYALENDPVTKVNDGVKFLEVTPDFKRVQLIRMDSLKPLGKVTRNY